MHGLGHITSRPIAQPTAANNAGAPSGISSGFQLNTGSSVNTLPTQRLPGAPASIASNSLSTLLLTQDVGVTPQGHGGGKGHGGMKMLSGLDTEKAGEAEEAEQLQQRKKLPMLAKAEDFKDDQSDEQTESDADRKHDAQKDANQSKDS